MKFNNYVVIILTSLLPIQLSYALPQECLTTTMVETTPTSRFTINTDGTVVDNKTNLMWKICSEGQTWNSSTSTCSGATNLYTWKETLDSVQGLTFASHSDWRIPNYKELFSIVEFRCKNLAANVNVFQGLAVYPNIYVWSSTPYLKNQDKALGINFKEGKTLKWEKFGRMSVKVVRSN